MPADGPLHVRLVTWDDDPPVGGQGVYVRQLRQALSARGISVTTVAGRGSRALDHRRVTGRGHLDLSLALHRNPEVLTDGGPDLVHVSGGPGGVSLVRRLPMPVVYTAHHTYRQAHGAWGPHRALAALEGAAYRLARAVAAVSPSTAEAVVAMGVAPERVVVISPGVAVPAVGAPVGAPVGRVPGRMVFLGRLEPEKGPLDAVGAMAAVARRVPGAHGLVIGAGPLQPEVQAAAGAGPVTVYGRLPDARVAEALRSAEVVLVPSAYEGLGLVALEAMAAGAAVVGYDVTGLRQTVGDGGRLVPPGDVGALAEATVELLTDTPLRQRLAAAGAAAVARERSWDTAAERFDALYRAVLSGGPLPGAHPAPDADGVSPPGPGTRGRGAGPATGRRPTVSAGS